MSNDPEYTGILEKPDSTISGTILSNPVLISRAVTSMRERIISLTFIFPKFTIPLRILSSSINSSEVSSRASERSFMLIFDLFVHVFFLTKEADIMRIAVTGVNSFSRNEMGMAMKRATLT